MTLPLFEKHGVRAVAVVVVSALLAACGGDSTGLPKPGPAALLAISSGDSATATVGTPLSKPLTVLVTDAKGVAVPGVAVAFSVSSGNGTLSPASAITDSVGKARTTLTVGTIAGLNQVTASVATITTPVRFTETGTPGVAVSLNLLTRLIRLKAGVDTGHLAALVADQFGNQTSPGAAWTVRNPSVVSVDSTGFLRVLQRGSQTYVVAASGTHIDSALVIALAPGQSACTGLATPTTLAVGQVFTGISGGYACVHGSTGAEYALVPYFDASVPSSTIQVEALGDGLGTLSAAASLARASRSPSLRLSPTVGRPATGGHLLPVPNDSFEWQLRRRERALAPLVPAARQWYAARRSPAPVLRGKVPNGAPLFDVLPANVQAGDFVTLNASIDACSSPLPRVGRVVAVTNKAVVVADTLDPAGGFTDAEYQSVGVTFDTLVYSLDASAFGAPADSMGNGGRIILFFTKAVNDLTPTNSGSVILGFFYARDLFPKTGAGSCATSNQSEMFYLMVPDTARSNHGEGAFSKTFVTTNTIGTTAHEFQHLINASRRMYVNHAVATEEETWLNEGLSHIAEELLFYRVSGLQPRHNIDASAFSSPTVLSAFNNYGLNNALRYRLYLQATTGYAPVGADDSDDQLQTRGAIWSFLRYAADRHGSTDGTFWFNLVNSQTSGIANLGAVLGAQPDTWMRDWAISNFTDDWAAGVASQYTQPSWNARSYMPGVPGRNYTFPLANASLHTLSDGVSSSMVLRGGGVSFLRFTVPDSQDALLTVTSNGQALPASVQLAIVRVQ